MDAALWLKSPDGRRYSERLQAARTERALSGIYQDFIAFRARATLRRHLVNIPARLARPQRKPILHLPTHWPWEPAWITLWHNTIGRRSSA